MMVKIYEEDDDFSDSNEEYWSTNEDSSPGSKKKKKWTLREVKQQFLHDFKPTSRKTQAQAKIEIIRMEGALADIDKYNSEFELYAKDTGYNNEGLMKYYRKGLPKGLADRISYLQPQPKNLETLQRAAVKQHMIWVERQTKKALWSKQRGDGERQTKGSQKTGGSQTRSMEVNAFQNNNPGAPPKFKYPPKLTNEEREKMKKEGRCFGCRSLGHTTFNCPTFPRSSTSNSDNTTWRPSIKTATTEASPSRTNSTMKEIAEEFTAKVRVLSGEEREKAAGYLKDLVTESDF
ncbi:hypothetical protein D9758_005043 [Tetrapyrgos nigripes]|uniref:Retrotransposon gag domain-containing protein n=1 Tax=Tetrapyrgos nigripes TaxID=182062 RepID=A0A8H5GW77_9AGAR|nr:hypothetical protein D9758_005043 [Tetrapyrgos nigripes]